ncbi:glycosyltransferase family 4 protein [Formosa sp. S-31]|uniref:glycosyltransferase family 4 protein n=1 Tax=Formosa sp. S-31 TaxID=2790949 RepID=UPI003EB86142
MKNNKKVLIVGTSQNTRGGITSVIKSHMLGSHWENYQCYHIETHIDKSNIHKLFYFINGFTTFLKKVNNYQLIHIHLSEPVSAIRKLPFFVISKLLNKKTVLHFHSFSPETSLQSNFKWLYQYYFQNSNNTIAISNYWKNEINKLGIQPNKVTVIYNPSPEVNLISSEKEKYILFAGTLNKRKGYSDLIHAFGKIAKNHLDWKLILAGNGEVENAKHLINKLNIKNQAELVGWIADEKKHQIFQKASVFCLPSYAEGFPMAVLDAWAFGIPVICTPVGGLPDIVEEGENALMFQCGDIDKLSEQLEKLIKNDNLRKSISSKSKSLSSTIFNFKSINKQVEVLYKSLLYS